MGPKERGTNKQTNKQDHDWRFVHLPVCYKKTAGFQIEITARGKRVNSGSGDGWEKKVNLNALSDIDEDCVSPKGWAAPRGSAILGQPVGPAKQASFRVPSFKN